jgi:hypothetical protein
MRVHKAKVGHGGSFEYPGRHERMAPHPEGGAERRNDRACRAFAHVDQGRIDGVDNWINVAPSQT